MGCGELAWLRGWIDQNPQWSRKQIARELCRRWDWVDGRGRLKDFGARSLLLTLGGWGQVKRPTLRTQFRRVRPKGASLEPWEQPPTWTAALAEMAPGRLEKIPAGSPAAKRWAYYLDRYHYLGFRVSGHGGSGGVVGSGGGSLQGGSQDARFSSCPRAPACGCSVAAWPRNPPVEGRVERQVPSPATRKRDTSRPRAGATVGVPGAAFSRASGTHHP